MLIKSILIGILRRLISQALGGVTVYLVKSGAATAGQIEIILAALAGVAIDILWTVGERLLRRWKVERALTLPQGATYEHLKAVADATPLLVKLKEAIQGQPGEVIMPEESVPVAEVDVKVG